MCIFYCLPLFYIHTDREKEIIDKKLVHELSEKKVFKGDFDRYLWGEAFTLFVVAARNEINRLTNTRLAALLTYSFTQSGSDWHLAASMQQSSLVIKLLHSVNRYIVQ